MEKIKVSPFEFAIAQSIAEKENKPEIIENLEPYTEEEIMQQKLDMAREFAAKIKVKPELK